MSAHKCKQKRGLQEEKYSEKFTTHSVIHSIFFPAVSNNHSHPHQNKKNTKGASLQHGHLALEAARDHRQPIRSQVVSATGEKKMLLH